jgi:hypothetical protein
MGWMPGRAFAACLAAAFIAGGCGGDRDLEFRAQVLPVVAKVTERVKAIAAVTSAPVAQALEQAEASLTDLAGLNADLRAFEPQNDNQKSFVSAGQAYLAATQRFAAAQQELARSRGRLDAARAKVKESLDARQRASQFTLDFWRETHERVVAEQEKVRKEAMLARDKLAVATASMRQSAEAAAAVLGAQAVIAPDALEAHRTAMEAIPLAN